MIRAEEEVWIERAFIDGMGRDEIVDRADVEIIVRDFAQTLGKLAD
jgi:hypothetical protein